MWPDEECWIDDLNRKFMFTGEPGTYSTWANDIQCYLKGYALDHHLLIDDTIDPDGDDVIKAARLHNRLIVHCWLNFSVSGNAKARIMGPHFIGKPALVWATLLEHWGWELHCPNPL